MVHGAVNDCRTKILLDTGASVSMLSFDFARKLKLKLRTHKRMKISGLGGVPTYISAHAEVKITLGPRVVYIFGLWVANIGEGVDVLLDMNFMFSAGVRLSTREGLIQLPDEEAILMFGGPDRSRMGLDIPVRPTETLFLELGRSAVVRLCHVTSAVIAATPLGDDASSESRSPEVGDQPKTLNADLDEDAVSDFPSQGFVSTPVRRLEAAYARVMRVSAEELDLEPAVYVREGSELMAQLRDQLTMLPELQDLSPECKIDEADVGEPGVSTSEMETKLRKILKYHRKIFLGDGNAAPAPARGVVCDLDVGIVRPVAQRARQIAPHLLVKVYELLKKLLETGLIEHSESEWGSPIVIVLKKNGVDIRMCIDYRVVNEFIKLSRYPLPLIDDLLIRFESAMWFMSLDMASGFWAVLMTERAKLVSVFICPFRHFQWIRMPFGLKNAPLIYQAVINNCLWGFVRLPPEEEALVDRDVLEFLKLDGPDADRTRVQDPERTCDEDSERSSPMVPVLTDEMTVFQRNIPAPSQMGPVLGRSSYIDDIAHGAPTWDQLCEDLNALLFRLRYTQDRKVRSRLAVSLYAQGVQSFLGSLNYYNKFIEDLPVVAASLYELTEEQVRSGRNLERAKEAFEILKRKIVSTPLLRHPDRAKPFVIIPHANPWAACAILGHMHDGVIQPVRFTGHILNEFELRYHIAEKEVLAILSMLELFRPLIYGSASPVVIYTRYSVLKWLLNSNSIEGRCLKWGLELSRWSLEIRRVQRDEDGLAAILGADITPREHLDAVVEELIPAKGSVKKPPTVSIEMLESDYQVTWLETLDARGFILEDVTLNDAEYHGLLNGLKMASERRVGDLVAVGDSRIVIQQVQGLINCNQPNLQRRLAEYEVIRTKFKTVQLVHVKRLYNQAADYLTSKTLALGKSWHVEDAEERLHLRLVSRIAEHVMKPSGTPNEAQVRARTVDADLDGVRSDFDSAPLTPAAKVLAVMTRARSRGEADSSEPMGPVEYQAERWRRIKVHQDGDTFLMQIKNTSWIPEKFCIA
ncbi:unnamed protein product [Phytophthora fragariaefolia]|uniref:RNA-directed DNA polymerase n=1 Tax=Phytophthora fragariaefolia TaxID=1490495 RepID=A0A9W6YJX5_9STRA|nr:unnamed protein product [Phytophthora fragariaefolia]